MGQWSHVIGALISEGHSKLKICRKETCQFLVYYALLFSTQGQAWDKETDGQTDDGRQRLMPPP